MKKMTSVIAIILLAALLITGCDFIPLKKDFSQYGFAFTIAGKVTEKEGNEAGNATLYTNMGTISFVKLNPIVAATIELAISGLSASKKTLDNGATFYTSNAKESDGVLTVATNYFIKAGDSVWQISASTPEKDYSEEKILKIFQSATFVTAE